MYTRKNYNYCNPRKGIPFSNIEILLTVRGPIFRKSARTWNFFRFILLSCIRLGSNFLIRLRKTHPLWVWWRSRARQTFPRGTAWCNLQLEVPRMTSCHITRDTLQTLYETRLSCSSITFLEEFSKLSFHDNRL